MKKLKSKKKERLIGRFHEHLLLLNRTPATMTSFTDHVRMYLETTQGKDLKKVSRPHIEAYIVSLYDHRTKYGTPYSQNTIIVKVRALKRFFEFLEAENEVLMNPAEFIPLPREPEMLPGEILTTTEVRAMLDEPNLSTFKGVRDRAILEVLYSTGIRRLELLNLTVSDANFEEELLRVNQGKGQKDRVVPLGKHAIRFLTTYLTRARPMHAWKRPGNRYLFIDRYGNPFSKQMVAVIIRQYAAKAGIKKRITPHTFRRTFASTMLKNGADILAVKELLGHKDLKATERYVRAVSHDLKDAHERTHPRETEA